MTKSRSRLPVGGASEEWAKAYAAFLGLMALVLSILLARGSYLALAFIGVAVILAASAVRRLRQRSR